ncbi:MULTISPECIES: PstS family phosphate ABC transporter substrate-binding protein [Cyanophyceae]|uniref:PstS family phosphate ABC transporter substrate-binding protein n=1 Tax=Cyanophyceae TaxID=3028117 RepID=UPI00168489BB|nr:MULTISPECIES: PstS family phosphate ABC transporter substrate-binding protein [Cyanophyceae]MBD1917693.1 PstS family phosphate ABC transporter substrate-binding protein [Phormidium sp. FACHB-77]MBD2031161.1 PstS family phosphate ABC transporter substrate-binding protein [Phormidium sp. FACHB-322]MBD2053590.1 PstS family phosphate ABC transporter substrate-binding protein [Leptolyngbya sp. FACHB-60]
MTSRQKFNRYALAGAITTAVALGIGVPSAVSQNSIIQIDGSSTVYPISEAMAEEFMAANRGTQVTVGVSGTGGGFSKFCAGELDITGASRPIKDSEVEACAAAGIEYIEVPVATDALTVVINPENDWADEMTVEQLQTLWSPEAQDTITNWNQIDPSWPDEPIELFGPGTDSGTFDYFTETIMGEAGSSRADYTASEDDNILVIGVSRDPNAIGYFGLAYYLENQDTLKAVSVNGVEPTPENVENGTYAPLSRPIFVYVKKSSLEERPEVRAFVEFMLENGPELVPEVGYVPLSEQRYADILTELSGL